ncbi:PspC domain-containing protein [Stomatohabitans albus]|uniref:PspC domain-containing protein n=1 Tax=Stomatohabitans albus TaxID=3110766 RepID=UPI00300CA8FF
MVQKRLYRSTRDKKFAGVIGGISEYLGWRASTLRLIYVILICVLLIIFRKTHLSNLGIFLLVLYMGLWILLPTDVTVWTQRVRRSRGI